jgi:hypothetical protein
MLIKLLTFSTQHIRKKHKRSLKSRGHHCGDIELEGYLVNETVPVPLVRDLRITHDRFGSSSDPSLNGNLHYPHNIDKSLNESPDNKIRKYRPDYNTNPPNTVSFVTNIPSTSGRLHSEFVSTAKNRVGLALTKVVTLRITINLDGGPITSKSHTHPSHSQTSRLLTSSLSLGVPVPRATQCM